MSADPRPDDLEWDVPEPVLFNTWKHHAGALRRRVAEAARRGDDGLAELPRGLVVTGDGQMDLYTGRMTPRAIADQVLSALRDDSRLSLESFRPWLEAGGGYRVLTFPGDGSRWVLRLGNDPARYVHVHAGRRSPDTRRVRTNVLKTAVLVLAYVAVRGGDPLDAALVNDVRRRYLGLPPMGSELTGVQGLGEMIDVLRSDPFAASPPRRRHQLFPCQTARDAAQ